MNDNTGFMQGLQEVGSLASMIQQRKERDSAQQAADADKAFNVQLSETLKSGGDLGELLKANPQRLEQIKKIQDYQTQLGESGARDASGRLFMALDRGDTDGARSIIESSAGVIDGIGDSSFTTQTALNMLKQNPEMLKKLSEGTYIMAGGKRDDLVGSGVEPMNEYQSEMIRQKDTEQELKRLELEQKKIDNQLKRETDDLKRQELEQRLSDSKEKSTQAQQAKEMEKEQSVSSTRATLQSVDALLNHPGLDAAVGASSVLPTIPGGEAADFETLLESFVGSLTMENMGQMKGVLSDSDIKMIKAASSGLDIKMSEKAFMRRLQDIKKRLEDKLGSQGVEAQEEETVVYTEGQRARNPSTGQVLIYRGGSWQPE